MVQKPPGVSNPNTSVSDTPSVLLEKTSAANGTCFDWIQPPLYQSPEAPTDARILLRSVGIAWWRTQPNHHSDNKPRPQHLGMHTRSCTNLKISKMPGYIVGELDTAYVTAGNLFELVHVVESHVRLNGLHLIRQTRPTLERHGDTREAPAVFILVHLPSPYISTPSCACALSTSTINQRTFRRARSLQNLEDAKLPSQRIVAVVPEWCL